VGSLKKSSLFTFLFTRIYMINRIKSWIRNYFGFSRRETNGTLVLFFLILLFILLPLIWDSFIFRSAYVNDHDIRILDSLAGMVSEKTPARETEIVPFELFMFDPNQISKGDIIKLGLLEPVAQRIINYRNAGGKFNIKSDLMKIYGLTDPDYQRLEAYIDLPTQLIANKPPEKKAVKDHSQTPHVIPAHIPKRIYFDINNADSIELISIKGIGPVLAARIMKFRQSLGGFTHVEQYHDVYGLSKEAAQLLQESSYIEEGYKPVQININFANRNELMRHPYIDQGVSRKIIDFRDKNGPFRSHESLKSADIIDDSLLYKLIPYIVF
jgi:competence protein ComEA